MSFAVGDRVRFLYDEFVNQVGALGTVMGHTKSKLNKVRFDDPKFDKEWDFEGGWRDKWWELVDESSSFVPEDWS